MNINSKSIAKFITNPKTAGISAFLCVGTMKTISDYKKAPENEKRRVLCSDALTLTGSCLTFAAVNPLTKKFCSTNFVKTISVAAHIAKNSLKSTKFFQKHLAKSFHKIHKHLNSAQKAAYTSFEKTEHISKECIASVINTFSGMLGAIYTNALLEKYVLNKPFFDQKPNVDNEKLEQEPLSEKPAGTKKGYFENSAVFNKFNYINQNAQKTAGRVFCTMTDMKELKLLEKPMVALTGYSIAKIDGYHNKFKKATYELIANTFVPTFFVSIASMFIENAKPVIKYPILLTALISGAFTGEKVAKKYKEKIDNKIDNLNLKYVAIK